MEKLQEVLQAIIDKYGVSEEDAALINEALLNIESPEYEGSETEGGEEFADPYEGEAEQG